LAVLHAWATTTLSGEDFAMPSRDSMQLFVAPQQDRDIQGEELLMKHFKGWQRR